MTHELRSQFAAKCDGTISPEEHRELEEKLAASAEVRRLWFEYCDMETGLADWASARAERDLSSLRLVPAPQSSHGTLRRLSALAAAAAAVIALGAFFWLRPAVPPARPQEVAASGVALLVRSAGADWEVTAPASGAVLVSQTLRLRSGAVLMELFSGARVIVEGPAELQLVSPGEINLRSGKLSAHVPPQARGFTVRAQDFTLVDHGTDFAIAIPSGSAPEVHVFTGKGEVKAAPLDPRTLGGGEAVRLEKGQWRNVSAAREGFVTEAELIRREAALAGVQLVEWREASSSLGAQAVVHFTFEGADAGSRQLLNEIPAAAEISHGSIVGAVWAEGRWPGKRALRFQGEADRVRFTADAPMQALTLLAWVRVDALPNWQNVLMSAESGQPGAFRWHLTQSGELRLEIARDLGRSKSDWEAVNSTPFVTPERFGRWVFLATTFDGGTIRHYGNGQPIGSGASFTPQALRIGVAQIGNWNGGTRRNLSAAIDEFAILPRALSAAEIAARYGAAR